ncbi:unnamed protein product, partial [Owenia fusiformis]
MATKVARSDQYIGETNKQIRNGFGVYNYSNKFFRYEGEWQGGLKHGHGKLLLGDGSYYEGEFTEGEITGHGFKYTSCNGNKYSGQFVQGEMHGQGIMEYGNNSRYEGEWVRNRRVGYGSLTDARNNLYQGIFYENKRHGEGTQTYENGDEYTGDWVQDKRQGHGELKCQDSTVYEGQWRNDMFNGQGTMIHSSGMCYEGMWINNKPATVATKLVINIGEEPLELAQGEKFSIEVACVNDDGELIEDMGRELKVIAGFRYYAPKEGSSLFEAIEEIAEDDPIPTPYGYDIVPYPLTDAIGEEPLDEKLDAEKDENEAEHETEENATKTDEASPLEEIKETKMDKLDREKTELNNNEREVDIPLETPQVPPMTTQRTVSGKVVWEDIILAPPPPMYRPFAIMEEEKKEELDKKGKKKKEKKKTESDTDESSRPNTRTTKKEKSTVSVASTVDEKVVQLGEYVIMVSDTTNPPFLGVTLETAFALVKVEKKKRKKSKPKKVTPAWDTGIHIAKSMR